MFVFFKFCLSNFKFDVSSQEFEWESGGVIVEKRGDFEFSHKKGV